MTSPKKTAKYKTAFLIAASLFVAKSAHASCTGSVVNRPFQPSIVYINKNTPVGQVISSTTITLTVTCDATGVTDQASGWRMNYTPQSPLQEGQLDMNTYGTNIPGLGYRMYMPDGTLIRPTSYGTNGGDNFGPGGVGPGYPTPSVSTNTYNFRLDLVRSNTALMSGVFDSSLVRFGYQDNSGYCNIGSCTYQFGSQITSPPVQFVFVPPTCQVTIGTANQTIFLPTTSKPVLDAENVSRPTSFNISLEDCAAETIVSMTLSGTTASPTVLSNTGSAKGVGVQILKDGSPIAIGDTIAIGNVGDETRMNIPLVAQYYRTGEVSPGDVKADAFFTMTYQ